MNEATRMQYLDAMSIEMFVPRVVLSHAKTSQACELPIAAAVDKAVHQTDQGRSFDQPQNQHIDHTLDHLPENDIGRAKSKASSAVSRLQNVLDTPFNNTIQKTAPKSSNLTTDSDDVTRLVKTDISENSNVPDASMAVSEQYQAEISNKNTNIGRILPHTIEDLTKKAVADSDIGNNLEEINTAKGQDNFSFSVGRLNVSEPARFMLNLWRVSQDVLVVDGQKQVEALPKEALLNNILQAVIAGHQSLPQSDSLKWPMVDDEAKDTSWQAAQDMVSYFLEGRLFTAPIQYLFLFGDDAHKAVLKAQPKSLLDCIDVPDLGCKALCFPSLGDILRDPLQKRGVWQSLRAHYLSSKIS